MYNFTDAPAPGLNQLPQTNSSGLSDILTKTWLTRSLHFPIRLPSQLLAVWSHRNLRTAFYERAGDIIIQNNQMDSSFVILVSSRYRHSWPFLGSNSAICWMN